MKKIVSLLCVFLLLFNICILVFAEEEKPNDEAKEEQKTGPIELKSKSAVLMEASTGEILYEVNSHEKLPPASVTKVMTMLLIMEALDRNDISLDDIVTTSEYASGMGGSQVYLAPGEEMSVGEMLKAIAVASANDASVAMAELISGTEEAFVNQMNKKAKSLGMNDTNFVNCNGLDAENHVTSAHDIALMSKELIKHPKIFEYLTIWMDSLRDGEFNLANTNKLIRFYKGADGIKTGSTSVAKYCLAATAKRDDIRFISVVMAAPTSKDRFADASSLLDYGFANYAVADVVKSNTKVGTINIKKGMEDLVEVETNGDLKFVIKKQDKDKIKKEIVIEEEIEAPVESGQKVGTCTVKLNNKTLGSCDLVTSNTVEKITFMKILSNLFSKWFKIGQK